MAKTRCPGPEDEYDSLAEANGVSKQESTVRAIQDAAARRLRGDKVAALSASARARYTGLLENLGD